LEGSSMKVRVFEIAKQAGKTPQEVLDELKKRGIEAKSTLSLVEDEMAAALLKVFAATVKPVAGEKEKPKPGVSRRIILPDAKPEKPLPAAPKPVAPPEPKEEIPAPVEEPAPVVETPEPEPVAPEASDEKAKPASADAPVSLEPAKPMTPLTPGYRPPAPKPKPAPAPVQTPVPAPAAAAKWVPGISKLAPAAKPNLANQPVGAGNAPVGWKPPVAPLVPRPMAGGPRGRHPRVVEKQLPKPKVAPPPPPKPAVEEAVEERKVIKLPESVTVSELADRMGIRAAEIIKKLMEYKIFATMNQRLSNDQAQTLALDFGFETEVVGLYGEDLLEKEQDEPARRILRSPVVTIMGHVDHGKTSLLDAIRKTEVAAGESGGITQHIGAYKVHLEGKGDVVFLDTPGHAAFTQMRARGAAVTDVVVLVVAADDGVQPQTLEAIDHARAAEVPIVVAINKIDKDGANPDRIMQELSKHNLMPEDWGGKTIYVQISAKKRTGIEKLLETMLLEAEMLDLKADPGRRGKGVVIEAKLDKGRGPVATVLVQTGIVSVGDIFVAGSFMGRVRALVNDHGRKVDTAGPSTPVEVLGFGGVPQAGDSFYVVENERVARQISQNRAEAQKERDRNMRSHVKLEGLFDQISQGELKELKIIIKADVSGSAEAIKSELERIPSDKVKVRVIHAGVGNINENDVLLADASDALVLGFHTKADNKAAEVAKEKEVQVRLYDVIYTLVGEVKDAMAGMLTPVFNDVVQAKGEVRGVFKVSNSLVAGVYLTSGKAMRSHQARLLRAGEEVWKGKLGSLKRFKDDVREVATGMECGVGLEGASDIQVGDTLEFYVVESVAQKL
jgi:translation initiation factor IF-2